MEDDFKNLIILVDNDTIDQFMRYISDGAGASHSRDGPARQTLEQTSHISWARHSLERSATV